MPNGDEGRAEFERLQRIKVADLEKQAYADEHGDLIMTKGPGPRDNPPVYDPSTDMLEKMHADDNAQSVEDAKRFTEEQEAWALKNAREFIAKQARAAAAIPDKKSPDFDPADDVEQEGDGFEYECSDGSNLDELAESLAETHMDMDFKGNRRGPIEYSQMTLTEHANRMSMLPKTPSPWDDPMTQPLPPSPLPDVLSEADREKLKNTIEEIGQGQDGGGKRLNKGKNKMELTLPEWDWALGDVSTKGSFKYDEWNWLLGMDWSAMIGCMKRHLAKFEAGERYDGVKFDLKAGTTGCHHLAMVAWNALALMTYDIREIGTDDRAAFLIKALIRINAETTDLLEDSDDDAPE